MGYISAEKILPLEIIELIQKYVDGENIYFDYESGQSVSMLAKRYYLSEKSIQRVLCVMKKESNVMSRNSL